MDNDEYQEFVRMVAENSLEIGDPLRHVAEICVIDTTNVPGVKTFRFSAEPYVDDPVTQTRLWPKDVLIGRENGDLPTSLPDDLRDLAVDRLIIDLYNARMEIENQTVNSKYPGGEE